MKTKEKPFTPDYAVHPGGTLEETFQAKEVNARQWAHDNGIEYEQLEAIMRGNAPIKPELARKLGKAGLGTAKFWKNSQENYEKDCERLKLWDVLVYEYATRRVDAVVGTALKEKGSFHTVGKRLDTVIGRLNDAYGAIAVPAGKFGKGDVLPKDVKEYDESESED